MSLLNIGTTAPVAAEIADSICKIIRTCAESHCSDTVQSDSLRAFTESVCVRDVKISNCTFTTKE